MGCVFIMEQRTCGEIGAQTCVFPLTWFRFSTVLGFGMKLRPMPEPAVVAVMGKPGEGEKEVYLMSLWKAVTVCLRGVVRGIVEGRGELGGVL